MKGLLKNDKFTHFFSLDFLLSMDIPVPTSAPPIFFPLKMTTPVISLKEIVCNNLICYSYFWIVCHCDRQLKISELLLLNLIKKEKKKKTANLKLFSFIDLNTNQT